MLLTIAAVLALFVIVVLGLAARQPATLMLTRSIEIAAAPEKIFPLVGDVKRWDEWQPTDGQPKPARMEVTDSQPPLRVVVAVDFARPFVAHNVNELTLAPSGSATRVTWQWRGTNVFMLKIMGVFGVVDKVMGGHFESGLAGLKRVAER